MFKLAKISTLASASVLAALTLPAAVHAASNPFQAQSIAGYQLADAHMAEGKCGGDAKKMKEGKCGADKTEEGKCGADKAGEGKCGGDAKMKMMDEKMKMMDEKMKMVDEKMKAMEGKCGEGKCGGDKKKK